jgi:hypothetical protein
MAFASARLGSSHHRAYEPMAELARRGHTVYLDRGDLGDDTKLRPCDVAYFQRHHDRDAQRLARRLSEAGVAIVWDHDDNVLEPPGRNGGGLHLQRTTAAIRAMAEIADVVTTTNGDLADAYRACGARETCVIENYLPASYEAISPTGHEGTVLGWIAWRDHQRDWQEMGLQGVVQQLLEKHSELCLTSVGPIDLGLSNGRYRKLRAVPFAELGDAIAGFDIGIAPLRDERWNQTRSNIKAKEYAGAGVPWLASPVGPYLGLGEQNGGWLVPEGDWLERLELLVSNARTRRRLAKRGRRWARTQLLSRHVAEWEAVLGEAIERRRRRR